MEVNPTEDLEKVKKAVENIFGTVNFRVESRKWGHLLTAETKGTAGLIKLCNLLRREQIRDASRRIFFSGLGEKTLTFHLNKQVAYAGHISFSQQKSESPLGPINIQILCDNPRELLEWLAPKTTKRKEFSRSK